MEDFGDLIEKLGGTAAVAAELDMTPDGVRKMRSRNWIQAKAWPRLIAMAERKGIKGVTTVTLARLAMRAAA